MDGIASTANALVDELEVDADGEFEVDPVRRKNTRATGSRMTGDHPTLTVRHFFYDWDDEEPLR